MAPHNHHTSDPRYVAFLEQVGDASCRQKLKDFQVELLRRRAEIEPLMLAQAAETQDGYETWGIHRALDVTVREAPFFFWQYGSLTCADVPPATATTEDLFYALKYIYGLELATYGFGDKSNLEHAPGMYQCATEQGYAGFQYAHTRAYLTPGFFDEPAIFPPFGVEKHFNPRFNIQLGAWSHTRAERVLLVYGENDPWSAGAFSVSRSNDSYRYVAPQGTHNVGIGSLREADQAEVIATMGRWMEVPVGPPLPPIALAGAEAAEQRRHRF